MIIQTRSSNRGEQWMKRNVPYIKIAVCTQDPHIGNQIREYAAGFEIRGNVEIEVEVMKNCYPLAKKILRREYYDIICLGRKLWDIDSYTLASSIRTTDRETIFFLLGWNRLTPDQTQNIAPISHLHLPLQKDEFRKELYRALSHLGPGRRYLSFSVQEEKGRILYRDIKYIRKSGSSLVIDTMKKSYRIPVTMTDMEQELTGIQERFIRVHRDYLVNSRYLSWFWNQEAGLMDGTRIPVSRIYKERVERVVGEKRKKIV